MITDTNASTIPGAYDFLAETYEDKTEEGLLKIWKDRFASYFPELVPKAREYRFRVYDPKNLPKSLVILTYDGQILEFKTTKYGSAELKTLN